MKTETSDYPVIDTKATGCNIRCIMDRRGISVTDIKDYLHLAAPQSIYHWLDGRNLPTIDNLYALSEMFQTPIDMIIRGNRKYRIPEKEILFYDRIEIYYRMIYKRKSG